MVKRRWTNNDEVRLIKLLQLKVSKTDICKALGRSEAAITNKINELKEQGVEPKETSVIKTVVIDNMGKTVNALDSSEPVVIVKKKRGPKPKVKVEVSKTMLNFNLFGENHKVELSKIPELANSLNALGSLLNKSFEINLEVK